MKKTYNIHKSNHTYTDAAGEVHGPCWIISEDGNHIDEWEYPITEYPTKDDAWSAFFEKSNITAVGWGGKREGAGRPSTGRKKQMFYVTDKENEKLREQLQTMRNQEAE